MGKVKTANISYDRKEAFYKAYFSKIHLVDFEMSNPLYASSIFKENFTIYREYKVEGHKLPRFEVFEVINPWLDRERLKIC